MSFSRSAAALLIAAAFVLATACDDLSLPEHEPSAVAVGEQEIKPPEPSELLGPGHLERAVERTAVPTCRRPLGMTVDRLDRIWLACGLLGEIQVIDPLSATVLDTYGPFFEHLYRVDIVPGDRRVIAAGMAGRFAHWLDMQTGRRTDYVKIGENIGDITPIPNTNRYLITATQDKTVTVLDGAEARIVRVIEFPGPVGYVVSGRTGRIAAATGGVWVSEGDRTWMNTGRVYLFDPDSDAEPRAARSLTVERRSREPVFVKDDTLLLVPNFGDASVSIFDAATASLVRKLDVGEGPERLVVSGDEQFAYCLNRISASVSVIRLSPPAVLKDIELPAPPEHAVISPDNKWLVVTLPSFVVDSEQRGNRLAMIDLVEGELDDLVPAGDDPAYLTQSRDGRRVYVSNFLDNTLSIFH